MSTGKENRELRPGSDGCEPDLHGTEEALRQIGGDMADREICLHSSRRRSVWLRLRSGALSLSCCDMGRECAGMNGKDEYEFHYGLDRQGSIRLFSALRQDYGPGDSTEAMLKKAFGSDSGPGKFQEFCRKQGIKYSFVSI